MPGVISLTGPSIAGKSTALAYFLDKAQPGFQPVVIPKYTTRAPRDDDGDEVICVDKLPEKCDLVYEQYGVRYGLTLARLFDEVADGNTPLVILNDVRTVEDVRASLGKLVRSVFLYRSSPSMERLESTGVTRGATDSAMLQRRLLKAQAIYRIYIENIHLFDHVIINTWTLDDLERQVEAIVRSIVAHSKRSLLRQPARA